MRYNKQELMALASQTSQNFDREGVLVLKERQDSFFRRSEGCSVRWFRLRGNLLFYLKGPEPWYEPMGVIVLGHHEVKIQAQDEHGHWPFHMVWENGVCYRMATFHETERTLWLKAMEMAPYETIRSQLTTLKERLNRIRPVIDIATYRLQKGIDIDMNEVPLCELALSCDNLLCDAHGSPPSPVIVLYVKFHKGLCVRYGTTEIVDSCSNPTFSKTILFRASDGLTGAAVVRVVAYDVRERVSDTAVPMGCTALQLSAIQEAQRLRVALQTKEKKTIGFVTMNGWSLEPSYSGTSPCHGNDRNSIEMPQKVLCHRRSQSLPPRLGLKLKFPSYGSLMKQNFVNIYQATYRFHSGLGGDITVHETMLEPKVCYQIPIQLLEIFAERERDLLEGLVAAAAMSDSWRARRDQLAAGHVALLKLYAHSKRRLQHVDTPYFKPSAKKDEASLEFAPVNLHLQRMWVHNDTLNKTGLHDIITAGAFTAHTHKSERNGGLIRMVQQVKDIGSKASVNGVPASKIQADYDNILAMRRLKDEIFNDIDRVILLLQAKQGIEAMRVIDGLRGKVGRMLEFWDPHLVEESLSHIDLPHHEANQTVSMVQHYMDRLNLYDSPDDCDYASSCSSKDPSPTTESFPMSSLSSSVPNVCPVSIVEGFELHFHHDYFKSEVKRSLNHSFRSARSVKMTDGFEPHKLRAGSLNHGFKSSASLEQVSCKGLMDNLGGNNNLNQNGTVSLQKLEIRPPLSLNGVEQSALKESNLRYLKGAGKAVEDSMRAVSDAVYIAVHSNGAQGGLGAVSTCAARLRAAACAALRWLRAAHAAARLCSEPAHYAAHLARTTARRDACFSQALTTVTAGLMSWLCSVPADIVVKVITTGLGPLCGFEGLLSLYATEKAMWGDMVVAVEDLQTVTFVLTKAGHSNNGAPQVSGTRGAITLTIPVSESLYARFSSKEQPTFTVTAVLFNIGINEKASLGEALGETTPQRHSNADSLARLQTYCQRYTRLLHGHLPPRASSSRTMPLDEVMEHLQVAVHKQVPKNVEVLHLAALATRLMNGVRFTSCKSAKDRTGMSVTREQCALLAAEYHLAERHVPRALAAMRSEGTRRENTLKNIGVRKYAFTKKQVMALPEGYRPPAGTYGSSQT